MCLGIFLIHSFFHNCIIYSSSQNTWIRSYRGAVRSQFELLIEHLVKGCCWHREHKQTAPVLPTWPQEVDPQQSFPGLLQGSDASGRVFFGSRLFLQNDCYVVKELLYQLGEFNSYFYVWLSVNTLPSIVKTLSEAILLLHELNRSRIREQKHHLLSWLSWW